MTSKLIGDVENLFSYIFCPPSWKSEKYYWWKIWIFYLNSFFSTSKTRWWRRKSIFLYFWSAILENRKILYAEKLKIFNLKLVFLDLKSSLVTQKIYFLLCLDRHLGKAKNIIGWKNEIFYLKYVFLDIKNRLVT